MRLAEPRKWNRLAVVVVIGCVAIAATAIGFAARSDGQFVLTPNDFSALDSPGTARSGVPADLRSPGSEFAPVPGSVHSLGRGAAYGWRRDGTICVSGGGVAGCLQPNTALAQPITPIIHDPDAVGEDEPARVSGLAADGVTAVTVTLEDGSTVSGTPVDNWFEVPLPDGAAPWTVVRISATIGSGREIAVPISLRPPAAQGRLGG